ncbi:hypothetical protein ABZ484_26000 [Streptomyces sp. NPDC006393]|uniref:hypothetical protein n=1 Tax=Streptomyces sp. NPDC006393 TaxID=3156763 RepID=UPI0033D3E65C
MTDLTALSKGKAVGRSLDGLLDSARDTLEGLLTALGPAVRSSLLTIRLAEQDAYPTTLRREGLAARDTLRDAMERGDQAVQEPSSCASGGSPNKAVASSLR